MDTSSSPTPSLEGQQLPDLSKLTAKDKQELQQFLNHESQRAQIQQTVHTLTDLCWKKCVTGTIKSGALDKNEESCAKNCVDRYLDANFAIIKRLNGMNARR
ncbi:Tim10/DDP family zinc finger [Drepanopeziza brunnea f. sp. 'multigermtubi' MB_m1]|uniref:Mitochondrial import inner membrane translocase subunit n=1 Tax=Marssonina brunnea f. sp. multigermtubi (strain MB_m1) TaxID=1072389 RepID=K1WBT2_MARBU|nr:Tim10/DDP family zinc finger [Drepanopeziza brunnea f. sp. 'multigermtubi' MB_m1]EKD14830.1 Tim10/DDP family zinc finger [Drepanopeziza brunnea f. sp. 'multigermtubi' MB_m1]